LDKLLGANAAAALHPIQRMNPPPDSEPWSDLIARVRAGGGDAADALVARLHPMVARTVQAHRPARDETADLVQEVFLRVFSKLAQYHGGFPFPHWVSRIAVNVCTDRIRHHARRATVLWSELDDSEKATLEAIETTAPDSAEMRDAPAVLERLLAALPPDQRALITWLELEQKSIAEVSVLTGWNSTFIRLKAFRARRKLAKILRELESNLP
jgi:RNA polymerase sigma factor (sigma-70 family)